MEHMRACILPESCSGTTGAFAHAMAAGVHISGCCPPSQRARRYSASRHAADDQRGRWARACASSSSECSGDGPPQNKPWPRIFTTPFAWQQMLSVRSLARSNGQFGPYSSRDRIRNAACTGRRAVSRTPAELQAACHEVYVSADALQDTAVRGQHERATSYQPAVQGVDQIRARQPVMVTQYTPTFACPQRQHDRDAD